LFKSLTGILKHKFRAEIDALSLPGSAVPIPDFSERFQEAYKDVHQHLPENKTYPADGMVEISFVPNSIQSDRKVSWKDMVLPELVDRICKLQDEGYDANDIAILVRTKEEGRKIANYLLDHKRHNEKAGQYNFDVISSESLFLKSSPAVNAIMYFIKLVMDHEDRIAAINFYYWLTHLKSGARQDEWDKVFRDACSEDGQQKLNQNLLGGMERIDFSEFRALPLTDLIEEISLLLNLDRYSQEHAYVLGLQNVVLEYLTKNHNDLHAFIKWWFEEGQNKSLKPSMEQNSIRILTIHQSKGLQFKQVLLPFCSWEIDHSSNNENILWASIELPVLEQIPVYPLRYSSQLGKSYFAEAYFREKSLAYMDNLNLLYVALTRAENGLFVFAEAPDKPDRDKTVGDLIQLFLQNPEKADTPPMEQVELNMAEFWNPEKGIFRLGNISRPATVDHSQITYSLEDFERGSWHHRIRIRRQADILDSSQEGVRGEKINYGILLHDLLAGIKTKEDLIPLLTQQVNTGNIAQNDAQRLTEMMHELWKNEKIADWFSGKWKIKTEAPVLPDKAQLRRMDRVMIQDDTAIVVDYKTGAKRPAHIDQVKDYMNILLRMGYMHVEGYILYINNEELIRV